DGESGRILASSPIAAAENGPIAVDPSAKKAAYVDTGGKLIVLDVAAGAAQTIAGIGAAATQLAWIPDGKQLLIGAGDGGVHVWAGLGAARELIASPLVG